MGLKFENCKSEMGCKKSFVAKVVIVRRNCCGVTRCLKKYPRNEYVRGETSFAMKISTNAKVDKISYIGVAKVALPLHIG